MGRVVQRRTAALPGKHAKKEPGRLLEQSRMVRAQHQASETTIQSRCDETRPSPNTFQTNFSISLIAPSSRQICLLLGFALRSQI